VKRGGDEHEGKKGKKDDRVNPVEPPGVLPGTPAGEPSRGPGILPGTPKEAHEAPPKQREPGSNT
jgi:hypothetical protein